MQAGRSRPGARPGRARRRGGRGRARRRRRRQAPRPRRSSSRDSGSASPWRGRAWRRRGRRPRPSHMPARRAARPERRPEARSRRRPRWRCGSRAGTRACRRSPGSRPDDRRRMHADDRDQPCERPGDGQRDERQVHATAEQVAQPQAEAEGHRVGEDPLPVGDREVGAGLQIADSAAQPPSAIGAPSATITGRRGAQLAAPGRRSRR